MQLGLEQAYGRKALTIMGSAPEVHRELLTQYRPDRLCSCTTVKVSPALLQVE